VTRRRSSAPGRELPARHRSLSWLLPPILLALIVVGCIPSADRAGEPSATPVSSASAAAPSIGPTIEPTASTAPVDTAAPTEAPTAAPTPTEPASSPEPTASGGGTGAACTGTDENRAFFEAVAADVAWPVYCPALPARWFVDTGQYHLAGGGWMKIAYKGPGGARFELSEGAFCQQADGCVPAGSDSGSAAFGNLSGTLVTADDGRIAVVVDRGSNPSWLAVGVGLDAATFKDLAANLVLVD
jgi:hypothetical protein